MNERGIVITLTLCDPRRRTRVQDDLIVQRNVADYASAKGWNKTVVEGRYDEIRIGGLDCGRDSKGAAGDQARAVLASTPIDGRYSGAIDFDLRNRHCCWADGIRCQNLLAGIEDQIEIRVGNRRILRCKIANGASSQSYLAVGRQALGKLKNSRVQQDQERQANRKFDYRGALIV